MCNCSYSILMVKILDFKQFMTYAKQYMIYTDRELIILAFTAATVFLAMLLLQTVRKKSGCGYKITALSILAAMVFSVWTAFIIGVTLINRESGTVRVILRLSDTFKPAFKGDIYSQYQLISNVLLFIPLGIFLPLNVDICRKWYYNCLICLTATACIEFTQLITKKGVFDVGDIVTNFTGGVIGYILYAVIRRLIFFIRFSIGLSAGQRRDICGNKLK